MKKIAIHQPNFIPWFPFFYKMAMVDIFVLLMHCQFEKNGYQNRYLARNGKWVTKPVNHGVENIIDKTYTDGHHLAILNYEWISIIKNTLDIKTGVFPDIETGLPGTAHLIKNIEYRKGNIYVTNPDAKDKYLDEELMKSRGIEIEYCVVPRNLRRHTFEIFDEYGIEGAKKLLPRRKECPELVSG